MNLNTLNGVGLVVFLALGSILLALAINRLPKIPPAFLIVALGLFIFLGVFGLGFVAGILFSEIR